MSLLVLNTADREAMELRGGDSDDVVAFGVDFCVRWLNRLAHHCEVTKTRLWARGRREAFEAMRCGVSKPRALKFSRPLVAQCDLLEVKAVEKAGIPELHRTAQDIECIVPQRLVRGDHVD